MEMDFFCIIVSGSGNCSELWDLIIWVDDVCLLELFKVFEMDFILSVLRWHTFLFSNITRTMERRIADGIWETKVYLNRISQQLYSIFCLLLFCFGATFLQGFGQVVKNWIGCYCKHDKIGISSDSFRFIIIILSWNKDFINKIIKYCHRERLWVI